MNKTLFVCIYFIFLVNTAFSQSDESSNLSYGMKLYNDKIYDVAVTQFKTYMEQYASSVSAPKVQFFLAESYLAMDDKENALKNYQKVILDYPKSEYCEASIIKTADLYKGNGETEKAARYYLQLKNYFPSSSQIPESYYKAIKLFSEGGMFENAKENAALLNKSYPKNNFTKLSMLILADIYEKENQSKLADRTYFEVIRSTSGGIKAEAGLKYAGFLLRQNDLSNAKRILKEAFSEAGKKDNNYHPILIKYTETLLLSNNYSEAAKLLENEKTVPDAYKTQILELKGDIEYFKGNYAIALSAFDEAINVSADFDLVFKKAHTLSSLKEYDKAGDFFFNAAAGDPLSGRDPEKIKTALINSSENYFIAKSFDKGILALKKYLEIFPGDQNSHRISFMIGRSYYDSGKYASAYEILKNHYLDYPMSEYIDDAVFTAAESAFKQQSWEKAYEQYDLLIKMYGASEFKALSESRMKFLTENRIRNSDLVDKLADLSSRSATDDNRAKLFLDWSKFYFYDMKDYAKSGEFLNKYSQVVKDDESGTEGRYIRAVSMIRLKSAEKNELKQASELLRGIISDPNAQKNWKFKACTELFSISDKIYEGTELGFLLGEVMEVIQKEQLDDPDGTLSYKYFVLKAKISKTADLVQKINTVFKSKTASVYFDETEMIKAEIYRASGDVINSDELLRNLKRSGSSAVSFKALNILSNSPNEKAADKIAHLTDIEKNFFYASTHSDITERKANIYSADGKSEKALVLYLDLQKELEKGIISSAWNLNSRDFSKNIADIYLKLNDLGKAETFYQKALLNKNANLDRQSILQKLSEIYKSQNNKTALEDNFKAMSAISGGSSGYEAAVALADIELEKGNVTKAITEYEEILTKFKPDDRKEVEAKIINANYAKEYVTQADNMLKEFQKKYKDNYDKDKYEPQFYLNKSNAFLKLNDYDKALKGYKALISDYPKSVLVPKALYGQAVCLYNIGKKDEAFEIWKTIVDKYPDDDIAVETNYHLGAIYNNREEFDKAIESFQKIIKYPKDHNLKKNTYKNIIDLYLKLGFNDAGGKLIREYISNYPDEDDVFQKRIEIGNIYQRNEEYDTALDYFKRLLYEAKGDDEAACQFFIAETYMLMKNYRQAITEFLKVKYLSKTDSPFEWKLTSVYKTALCYEELNEFDKALELLDQIAKDHAADSYGKQAKKIIERIQEKKSVLKD